MLHRTSPWTLRESTITARSKTKRAVIYGSEVFTPYGVETARSMQSVGLAPHETKTVWYYVYLDESNPLLASPLAGEGDDAALGDEGGEYGPIQLESGKRIEYYSEDITSLANIELVSFDAEEAKRPTFRQGMARRCGRGYEIR